VELRPKAHPILILEQDAIVTVREDKGVTRNKK